jgi:HD-like signal output (HDOD) protein/ActR/RegA family two-component response regulator
MRRVLFVDDEPRILEGLRRMLRAQRNEWDMAFAPGGEAALAMMEATPFDVIVSDLRMPEMDGAALLTQVRNLYPQVVRIVLSGHTELSTALRVVPVAHQFLAKPCDAGTLRVAVERACHLKGLLSDDSIRRTVGALRDIPSLPRTYEALMQGLTDPDTSLQKLAKIVEQDVGVSAKILQLVNSAFFGIAHPVTNIEHAVVYLGINTIRSLVLSLEIFRVFAPEAPMPGFNLEILHRHARFSALIAARLPVPKHLAEITMAAGMLHDVGKLVLAWKFPDRFKRLLDQAAAERLALYKVEESEYGFSHAEIGGYLLGLWGLPYVLAEAVALHHGPNRVPHEYFDAVSAVHVANLLAHELDSPSPEGSPGNDTMPSQEELKALGVGDDLAAWRAMAAETQLLLAQAQD